MRTTIDAAGRLVVSEGSGTSAGFAVGTVESASAGTVLPGVLHQSGSSTFSPLARAAASSRWS